MLEDQLRAKWRSDAICVGVPTEVFLLGPGRQPEAAYEYCDICPVQEPCLDFAMDLGVEASRGAGVYGGTTGLDRRKAHLFLKAHNITWRRLTQPQKQALLHTLQIGQDYRA